MWASWPQACMTPGTVDFQGTSTASWMGRASRSARRATTGPGFPPFSTPTTPVPARRRQGMPSTPRMPATRLPVRVSRLLSSGWAWMSRRQATTSGWSASAPGLSQAGA